MATVIGVRFKKAGKVYYFDPSDVWPRPGDNVVVETTRGVEFGEVVTGAREVADEQIVAPLKKVVARRYGGRRAPRGVQRKARGGGVPHLPGEGGQAQAGDEAGRAWNTPSTAPRSSSTLRPTAGWTSGNWSRTWPACSKRASSCGRSACATRPKCWAASASCGRPICCGAFLGDFQPVSIKMAKEQNLSLNPTKISGHLRPPDVLPQIRAGLL